MLSRFAAVIEASGGLEALQLARKFRPTLIISDSAMPSGSGSDLVAALKREPELAQIPVILTSGYSVNHLSEMHSPAPLFLQKPFTWEELNESIQVSLRVT